MAKLIFDQNGIIFMKGASNGRRYGFLYWTINRNHIMRLTLWVPQALSSLSPVCHRQPEEFQNQHLYQWISRTSESRDWLTDSIAKWLNNFIFRNSLMPQHSKNLITSVSAVLWLYTGGCKSFKYCPRQWHLFREPFLSLQWSLISFT